MDNNNIFNNIDQLIDDFKKDKSILTTILIGSGVSKTAGIPTGEGFKKIIKEKEKPRGNECDACTYASYSQCMSHLRTAGRQKRFIKKFIDKAKINIAHFYLGALVKAGYINRILTTNFDPLIVSTLSLYNIYPNIYDFASSDEFIPIEVKPNSIFHLHGQINGFVLLNTEPELNKHYNKVEKVFEDSNRNSRWIVIGYSGDNNEPAFKYLSSLKEFHNGLYWIGHKDDKLKSHVLEKILTPENKSGYYIKGYNADTFFFKLAKELNLIEPQIIEKPFSYLKNVLDKPLGFPLQKELKKHTIETKILVEKAIPEFENGNYETRQKIIDILVNAKYDELNVTLFEELEKKDIEGTASKLYAYALTDHGIELVKKALKEKEAENIYNRYDEAKEEFKNALILNSDFIKAWYNLGNVLVILANIKINSQKNRVAKTLYYQAIEKYNEAIKQAMKQDIKIDPDYFNKLGEAYLYYGKIFNDKEESKDLYNQAKANFERSSEIMPDYKNALDIFRNIVEDLAEESNKKAAEKFLEKLIEIDTDSYEPDYFNKLKKAYLSYGEIIDDENESKYYYKLCIDRLSPEDDRFKGSLSYTICSAYALMEDEEKFFKWFEKSLKSGQHPSKDKILFDGNLKYVRNNDKFKDLINTYLL